MAKIYIDDKPYEVDESKNLLETVLSLGFDLPYFCWHPALGSVGACRQCAVKKFKDENDKKGKIVMACMEQASDGTRISIYDPEAVEFRQNIIEWLMVNHPHDCPICDEGGECHLQDMTLMSGHVYRRYRFKKRTHLNQYLGPFINHEMNRCIQCYRCVRFYREYADGRDFNVFAAHDHVYFGRSEEGVLENEFSGNLVEVCPTGVFTDKTLKKHYTRKWDLQNGPSVCHLCGLGCNILAGERYGSLRRILTRYNSQVNGYFICDRGRFGYEFVNSENRISGPLRRGDASGELEPVDKTTILNYTAKMIQDGERRIGIGSPRASLESNFMLRQLVGAQNFYAGIDRIEHKLMKTALHILHKGPARTPSLKECEQADAILILGEDVINSAPMLGLALRQAARSKPAEKAEKLGIQEWHDAAVREVTQDEKGPFYIAMPYATKLDEITSDIFRGSPDEIARFGFAIANALDSGSPKVNGLEDESQSLAKEIAKTLKNAERPLIVTGTSCRNEGLLKAAANIAWALCRDENQAGLSIVAPEANSLGLALMDARPIEEVLSGAQSGKANVIILENDLFKRAEEKSINRLIEQSNKLIAIEFIETETTRKADVVLPAGAFAESDGTLVNNEGRAQRFYQAYVPKGDIQESWRWLIDLMQKSNRKEASSWKNLQDCVEALEKALPAFKGISEIAPPPGFREAGQKIPRQPHRYSGRTAMNASVNVNEPKPPDDPDSALSFSMEGYRGEPPSSIIPYFWAPAWNSVQSMNKYQIEVGGPLHGGDPGRRLIKPSGKKADFYTGPPESLKVADDEWQMIPIYHIFGSDEMSRRSPAIAERTPQPYVAMNPEDAKKMQLEEGNQATVKIEEKEVQLPVKIRKDFAKGLIGLPAGFPEISGIVFSAKGKILGAKK